VIRVPLRALRTAFADPARYVRTFKPSRSGGGPSKYGMLLFAVGVFHRTNNDRRAQEYLEEKIVANFEQTDDLTQYSQKLQEYAQQFRALGNIFLRVRDNIAVPIPPRFDSVTVSGQAARVDLVPSGGYAVWVFNRNEPDWQSDPRMPLLQFAYSRKLGVSPDEVRLGAYDFKAATHFSRRYSNAEILDARHQLEYLLNLLQKKT
jgi:hypothetical protein